MRREIGTKSFPHQTALLKFCHRRNAREISLGPRVMLWQPCRLCHFRMKVSSYNQKKSLWSHSLSNILNPDFVNHKNVIPEIICRNMFSSEVLKWKSNIQWRQLDEIWKKPSPGDLGQLQAGASLQRDSMLPKHGEGGGFQDEEVGVGSQMKGYSSQG